MLAGKTGPSTLLLIVLASVCLASATQAQTPSAEFEAPQVAQPMPSEELQPSGRVTPPSAAAPAGEAAPISPNAAPTIAPPEAVAPEALTAPGPSADTLPHDLSPIGMFMAADWVVKGVMSLLALASAATWTIWLAKSLQLAGAKMRLRRSAALVADARSLEAAVQAVASRAGTVAAMVRSADKEMRLSGEALDFAGGEGVKERVCSSLSRIEIQAGRRMSAGTGLLATIGSVAPFVGLFGTVWGIMNSFIGISQAQTTNLAVVAPGIAEALLATAIGLVAAIPAVVIYNVFARAVTGYRQSLADAGAAIERLVSRDIDYRKVPGDVRAAKIKLVTE